jgi:hypothetical protein
MPTIYLHGSVAVGPDTADRLAHLTDAGHRVVLVAAPDHPAAEDAVWSEQLTAMPADAARGSWYLTADPATCGDRRPGLRTVLVGPRSAQRTTRCDTTARDLRAAVFEILAADAMPPA